MAAKRDKESACLEVEEVNKVGADPGCIKDSFSTTMDVRTITMMYILFRMNKAMEMKANEAYGPVSSSQPPLPPASEGAYDL